MRVPNMYRLRARDEGCFGGKGNYWCLVISKVVGSSEWCQSHITIIGLPSVSWVMPWRKLLPSLICFEFIFSEALAVALFQFLVTKQGLNSGRCSEALTLNDKVGAVAMRW